MHKPKNEILEYVRKLKQDRDFTQKLLLALFKKHTAHRISHLNVWYETNGDPFLIDVAEKLVEWKLIDAKLVIWK